VAYHQADDILINSVSTASLEAVKSYERAAAAAFPQTRGKQVQPRCARRQALLGGCALAAQLQRQGGLSQEGCNPEAGIGHRAIAEE
jgi:hypothetical protein